MTTARLRPEALIEDARELEVGSGLATDRMIQSLQASVRAIGIDDRDDRLFAVSNIFGRHIKSFNNLRFDEARWLLDVRYYGSDGTDHTYVSDDFFELFSFALDLTEYEIKHTRKDQTPEQLPSEWLDDLADDSRHRKSDGAVPGQDRTGSEPVSGASSDGRRKKSGSDDDPALPPTDCEAMGGITEAQSGIVRELLERSGADRLPGHRGGSTAKQRGGPARNRRDGMGLGTGQGRPDPSPEEMREAIARHRRQLKMRIWQQTPACFICSEMFDGPEGIDLHEGILKRSDGGSIKWQFENRRHFFDDVNCVLLHSTCHDEEGQSRSLRGRLIEYRVRQHGKQFMLDWLDKLPLSEASTGQVRRLISLVTE